MWCYDVSLHQVQVKQKEELIGSLKKEVDPYMLGTDIQADDDDMYEAQQQLTILDEEVR